MKNFTTVFSFSPTTYQYTVHTHIKADSNELPNITAVKSHGL